MEEQAQRRIDDAADAVKQMRVSQLPDPMSIQHLMTHLPKHPDCPDCQKAKLKQVHCRRVPPERKNKITEFGQELSADTLLSKNEASTSLEGDKFAIIFHDEGTGWLEGAPDGNRNIEAARRAFRNLAGSRQTIDSFYCDNAGELTKAADELEWVNPTATPFLSKSNSRAERRIGHAKEGTRTALLAAGMPPGMWNYAMKHFCVSSNIEIIDGESAYSKRHKHGQFKGKRIPFGARIDFLPPPTLQKQLPVFAPKAVPGVFLGWHMHPGGYWSRDYLVGYLPDFEAKSGIARGARNKVRVYRVRNLVFDDKGPVVFPLKVAKTRVEETIDKVADNVEPLAITSEEAETIRSMDMIAQRKADEHDPPWSDEKPEAIKGIIEAPDSGSADDGSYDHTTRNPIHGWITRSSSSPRHGNPRTVGTTRCISPRRTTNTSLVSSNLSRGESLVGRILLDLRGFLHSSGPFMVSGLRRPKTMLSRSGRRRKSCWIFPTNTTFT